MCLEWKNNSKQVHVIDNKIPTRNNHKIQRAREKAWLNPCYILTKRNKSTVDIIYQGMPYQSMACSSGKYCQVRSFNFPYVSHISKKLNPCILPELYHTITLVIGTLLFVGAGFCCNNT